MDRKARVLLVDDNPDILESFTLVLRLNGYTVDTATDGLSALEKCRHDNYDAVLMDIFMPRLNGMEAFHRIRGLHPELRVILMSAYTDGVEIETALKEGLFRAVGKPMRINYLLNVIQEATADFKVIIVDDDVNIGGTLTRILKMKGYSACAVLSGEEAIKLLAKEGHDIEMALIDIKMPDMDGFATLERLKEIKPALRTVLMTAYQDEMKDKITALAGELDSGCLYKPFEPSKVVELVGKIAHRGEAVKR